MPEVMMFASVTPDQIKQCMSLGNVAGAWEQDVEQKL